MDADHPDVHIVHRGNSKRISEQDSKLLKRCQAIEPMIGRLMSDNPVERGHLKDETDD